MTADGFDVKGRIALVTGGGTGVGKAVAAGLSRAGWRVLITGRRKDVLEKTATELSRNSGNEVSWIAADACQACAGAWVPGGNEL